MKAAALCMGIGGLDLAVEAVYGCELAWCAEYEPAPASVIERHWPGVPNLHDLTSIDWAECEPVDILTAGYPCQPFSHAGKRKGKNDVRHLWPYVAEAVRVLRPRRVVLENVAGHLSLGFGDVLRDLAQAGYDAEWCVLRASDVGAPHQRARLFIVARDTHRTREDARPTPGRPRDPAGESGGAVADADSRGRGGWGQSEPATSGHGREGRIRGTARAGTDAHSVHLTLLPTPAAHEPGGTLAAYHDRLAKVDGRVSTFAPLVMLAPRLTVDWGVYEPAIRRWEALTRPAPAPTVDGKLSPAFVEWMMGYPTGWVDLPRNPALKALGNAVCPQQGTAAVALLEDAHRAAAVAA